MKELKETKSEINSSEHINDEINDTEYHDRLSKIVRDAVQQNEENNAIDNNTSQSDIKKDENSKHTLDVVNQKIDFRYNSFMSYKLALSYEHGIADIVSELRRVRYSNALTSEQSVWGSNVPPMKHTNKLLKSVNNMLDQAIVKFEKQLEEAHTITSAKYSKFLNSADTK